MRRALALIALAASVTALVLIPAAVVAALRWLPPPTTAFIWERSQGEDACSRVRYRWVSGERIPDHVALAVVAAEDQRFWQHRGFDVESIREAVAQRILRGRVRGASTITQQVAKNLFLWNGRSWLRKALEAYLTVFVEGLWPKRRILEMYLNVAQLGPCTFGVAAGSEEFFGKRIEDMTRSEAALLAAVLPNPLRRRAEAPSIHLRRRAEVILSDMARLEGTQFVREF
jgi:monofunctional biosynthetic peptidoglycan transglycosylase